MKLSYIIFLVVFLMVTYLSHGQDYGLTVHPPNICTKTISEIKSEYNYVNNNDVVNQNVIGNRRLERKVMSNKNAVIHPPISPKLSVPADGIDYLSIEQKNVQQIDSVYFKTTIHNVVNVTRTIPNSVIWNQ